MASTEEKKRKMSADEDSNVEGAKKAKQLPPNRGVFITGLPPNTTREDIEDTFSRRGGMIDEGIDGMKRVTMYADDEGNFKGEALVIYFDALSVEQSITLNDDSDFWAGNQRGRIKVEEASRDYKKHNAGQVIKFAKKDKHAIDRNKADLRRRQTEWSDDEEPQRVQAEAPVNKWANIVVIKNAFTLEYLEEDPEIYDDIREGTLELCEKFGEIYSLTIWDKEPAGIVTIKFKDSDCAKMFVSKMDGQSFGPMKVQCSIATERPKFKKSREKKKASSESGSDVED